MFGPVMCQSFGQTEFHLVTTWLSPQVVADAAAGNHPERLASCGQATYSVRVELMDDDGNILPTGEVGEIVGRGSLVGAGVPRIARRRCRDMGARLAPHPAMSAGATSTASTISSTARRT